MGPFLLMGAHVFRQMTFQILIADRAHDPVPTVAHLDMAPQRVMEQELFPTILTNEIFEFQVAFHMHVQAVAAAERHAAQGAFMATLHHVFLLMLHQHDVVTKHFVTVNAFE